MENNSLQTNDIKELEKGRAFIDKIRKRNGGLTKAQREHLQREDPEILESFDNLRSQLSSSTQLLAEQLYKKPTRFVYELIQNAEDNHYEKTTELPWLAFTLKEDKIIIDSNEDGFTEEDISAVCAIAQSTKSTRQGYIGEKGIGFKSVFNVAQKVHVQSGPYSFAFEYRKNDKDDNGLGMVTPLNEDANKLPEHVRTRTILYLLENCDRAQLLQELLGLPDTLLLFLTKLKRLTLRFKIPAQDIREIQYLMPSHVDSDPANLARIIKTTSGKTISEVVRRFYVQRHYVNDMPADSARKKVHEAEVVLGFPLDDSNMPIIEDQHVFAYLPLKKAGYTFLIHSDFITQANREDLADSTWNRRLIGEVAEAFCRAVTDPKGFLSHSRLRYSWVRFLPASHIADEFWGRLKVKIMTMMREKEVFYSADESQWLPSSLRIVGSKFRDEDDKPLLPDSKYLADAYISRSYDAADELPVLRHLGVRNLDEGSFLQRLEYNLIRADVPRMRKKIPNGQWQTKIANILIRLMPRFDLRIERMPIIPLDNGKWVKPLNASIYFPTSGGVEVPQKLLSLVDEEALENSSRKRLFELLGIAECSPKDVFPLIQQRYELKQSVRLKELWADIKFLFWHHSELPSPYKIYLSTTSDGKSYYLGPMPKPTWIYSVRSEHPYATHRLFKGSVPALLKGKIGYLRTDYYDILEQCGVRNERSAVEWLRSLGIKETPQLSRPGPVFSSKKMSEELKYIAEELPQYLLGVLEANWTDYPESQKWNDFFKDVRVPILDSSQKATLRSTFLPLPKLKKIVSDLELEESFGFLQELDGFDLTTTSKWRFLQRFNVGLEEDARFWLALLKRARQKKPTDASAVFRIYSQLQRYSEGAGSMLTLAFEDDLVLLPPGDDRSDCGWTNIRHVLWDGPDWYTYMTRLRSFNEYRSLQFLFTEVLAVKDASIPHFLNFLREISKGGSSSPDLDKVTSLYDKLAEALSENNASSPKEVRFCIEQDKLVYYPGSKTWHAPSSCIWAPVKVQLPGKISLATAYTKQRRFFEDVLKIPKPSVQMHIAALQDRARTHPIKAAILQEMQNICAFSPSTDLLRDKLADCKCFPIQRPSGKIDWMASTEEFAIADRKEYASIFIDKIDILDFSLDEVHAVRSILSALGLERRFMSKVVREETNVKDGTPLASLTAGLRRKAYAICRFAIHLRSSTAMAAFSKLQALEVFATDGISKRVSITQNGRSHSVQVSAAYFHVVQTEDRFELYVPEELRRRQVCLARQLPIKMLESLGVPDPTSGIGLGSIITASSLFVVDAILDEDGIISVPDLCRPEEEGQDASSTDSSFVRIAKPDSSDVSAYRVPPSRNPALESHNVSEIEVEPEIIGNRASFGSTYRSAGPYAQYSQARITPIRAPSIEEVDSSQPPSEPIAATPQPEEPKLYKHLLDAVIDQAKSLRRLPVAGHHLISTRPAKHWIDTSVAVRSIDPGDCLNKVGAAGELFVFELLLSLDLPDFGLPQWQSTIRDRARVHELYSHLQQWTGSETADIVYHDRQLRLTEILIDNGYLFPQSGQPPFWFPESVADSWWNGPKPKYYVEVKTTPGPLDAPFFCSEGQVQRMEDMKFKDALPSEIYLIARVFGLGSSSMGVKLYVDPATLREHGRLNFKGGKYAVTPG